LYLASYCTNKCVYCGFHAGRPIARKALTADEIEEEAKALAATGLRRVLALTGDAPARTGAAYIAMGAAILARYFPSVGIEVPALTLEEYAAVAHAGVDSMTMFQETYNQELYARLHPAGPKSDFAFRLDAPQRAAAAGMRGVTLGVLLGLGDWRFDIFMLGMHAAWMQRKFPHLELSFSLPRLRPCFEEESRSNGKIASGTGAFDPIPISDREFVQAMTALRCFLPHAGITLSTRESAFLRDRLLPLGVTRLSAGVSTAVGGYAVKEDRAVQFVIDDQRSVQEVVAALAGMGYQPVFADWLLPDNGNLPLTGALNRVLGNPDRDARGMETRV
jgi:2-iminoacetate synthase